MCPSRSHANADNAKASVVAPVTTSSQVAFEVGRSVAKSSIAASYPLTPSAATDVLEGPLTQAKSMPVQCLARTGGPRMQENSDNQIALFVRGTGRRAFNQQALKALGIDPAEARDLGYPLTNPRESQSELPA